jgi:hypothetical protein
LHEPPRPGTLMPDMVAFLLVWNRALDYGRVVTCGCPEAREPR